MITYTRESLAEEALDQIEQLEIFSTDLKGNLDNAAVLRLAGINAVLSNVMAAILNNFEG